MDPGSECVCEHRPTPPVGCDEPPLGVTDLSGVRVRVWTASVWASET